MVGRGRVVTWQKCRKCEVYWKDLPACFDCGSEGAKAIPPTLRNPSIQQFDRRQDP